KDNVAIAPVIERITQKFAQVAKESLITLKFESAVSKLLTAEVDEDRIEQVLTNLIDNAIRHTPNEGKVSVRVEQHNAFVKISVEDTGSGIPAEDLPFVFERFYKADKSRTRGKGGTGLGL
ncbi:cell wall metabolism sensor histidine kinase WalK, partial [Leptospira santarosai]|nr:cell wall metabolism sensor histidine kinase WalK [Leptospira santarosai]